MDLVVPEDPDLRDYKEERCVRKYEIFEKNFFSEMFRVLFPELRLKGSMFERDGRGREGKPSTGIWVFPPPKPNFI